MQSLNVNLQVVELEQHILYGMMDVGRGVTKDQRTIYIYIYTCIYIIIYTCTVYMYLSHSHSSYPFMWGSLRLAPNTVKVVLVWYSTEWP